MKIKKRNNKITIYYKAEVIKRNLTRGNIIYRVKSYSLFEINNSNFELIRKSLTLTQLDMLRDKCKVICQECGTVMSIKYSELSKHNCVKCNNRNIFNLLEDKVLNLNMIITDIEPNVKSEDIDCDKYICNSICSESNVCLVKTNVNVICSCGTKYCFTLNSFLNDKVVQCKQCVRRNNLKQLDDKLKEDNIEILSMNEDGTLEAFCNNCLTPFKIQKQFNLNNKVECPGCVIKRNQDIKLERMLTMVDEGISNGKVIVHLTATPRHNVFDLLICDYRERPFTNLDLYLCRSGAYLNKKYDNVGGVYNETLKLMSDISRLVSDVFPNTSTNELKYVYNFKTYDYDLYTIDKLSDKLECIHCILISYVDLWISCMLRLEDKYSKELLNGVIASGKLNKYLAECLAYLKSLKHGRFVNNYMLEELTEFVKDNKLILVDIRLSDFKAVALSKDFSRVNLEYDNKRWNIL